MTVTFHLHTVSLHATFPDGSSLRFTLDGASDHELRWGFWLPPSRPPGWKDLFVLRTPTTFHLPLLQMAGYYNPGDVHDPQKSTLCCMMLDKDARPDAACLRRQLLAMTPWRPFFCSVSDAECDELTVNRRRMQTAGMAADL